MTDKITISIIICTYNRAADLEQTLNSLRSVSLPKTENTELIVVDNGSTDDTAQIVKSFSRSGLSVRYIYEGRRGKGYAYNSGISAARGRALLFSDDDIRFPCDWIEGMSAPILAGEVDALAGGVRMATHLERPWMQSMHRLVIGAETGSLSDENFELVGANMAFSRAILHDVPAFDPELGPGAETGLWSAEETLFSYQVLKAGYRIKLHKEVSVEHHFNSNRLSHNGFANRAVYTGRSRAYLAYHWQHKVIRWPLLRYMKAWFRLKIYRASASNYFTPNSEGMPLPEFDRLSGLHFYKQYLRERRRPRNYKQYGLKKLHY